MKLLTIALCCMLLACVACNNASSNKEESADAKTADSPAAKAETPPPPAPVDSAKMMKMWAEYKVPGPMHSMMKTWDGNWTAEVTMWMSPSQPPTKSTGKCVNKMILGGMYQESSFNGMMKMPDATGKMIDAPFNGRGTLAYDNSKKVFISTWIDNMGSGVMKMEGPWDEATKSMSLKGKMVDPTTGQDVDMRELVTIVDDNTQKMEMFCNGPDGKEMKNMEIVFKRSK
ncbi:MAG: DUF1579 domain-containing protein [Chitinophagaceae bacterium]